MMDYECCLQYQRCIYFPQRTALAPVYVAQRWSSYFSMGRMT